MLGLLSCLPPVVLSLSVRELAALMARSRVSLLVSTLGCREPTLTSRLRGSWRSGLGKTWAAAR